MRNRGPLPIVIGALVALVAIIGAGTALGVGPLAPIPADVVSDPREMVARSLQATLDATSVHLAGTLDGTIPGALVDRAEAGVALDGTTLDGDLLPKDGKTRTHITSPGLEIDADAVTVWDGAWYRTGVGEPWQRASLGAASAGAGVDINPLTLVDRLRSYLSTPGVEPTLVDVTCAFATGQCHRITIELGRDPSIILRAMLPLDRSDRLPVVRTTLTLDTDVDTLRPVRLVIDTRSEDGTVDLHLVVDASDWDAPGIEIEEPPAEGG